MMAASADVCVIGGGSAGVAAAVTAARAGSKVVLIERYGFLGGMGTAAIIGTFCGLYRSGPNPHPLSTAFGWTIVRRLLDRAAAYRFPFGRTLLVHYDPEVLKLLYDELLEEAGVCVLLHTSLVGVKSKDGRVESVDLHTRSGRVHLQAELFLDCSGDAELCHLSGARTEFGDERGLTQPATAVFRMAGIDLRKAIGISRHELNSRMEHDKRSGDYPLPRTSGSYYPTTHPGEAVINMTRIVDMNGIDPEQLSAGEKEGRRQIQLYAQWLKQRIPGFENAYVSATCTQLGIRETRRIVGRRQLTAADLRAECRSEQDIAEGAWPFEMHDPKGAGTMLEWLADGVAYQIPLDATWPADLENVFVAGRCLSTSHEAHASTRVMGTCFATGEAIGWLAAKSVQQGRSPAATSDLLIGLLKMRAAATEPTDDAWPEPPGLPRS
jgi:hypothetical protein